MLVIKITIVIGLITIINQVHYIYYDYVVCVYDYTKRNFSGKDF